MTYDLTEKQFLVIGCLTKLTLRLGFNKEDIALNPLNKKLLYPLDKLRQSMLWVLWMHPVDIFWNVYPVNYFPRFETYGL